MTTKRGAGDDQGSTDSLSEATNASVDDARALSGEVLSKGIRSRIVGHGEERVSDLVRNPNNWRVHPKGQIAVVSDSLATLGWLRGILKNVVTGNMIDGHLRAEIAERNGEETVPCTYVELTPEEEDVALALLDPSGAMATANQEKLATLLEKAKGFFADQRERSTFQAADALLKNLKREQRSRQKATTSEDGETVSHTGKREPDWTEKADVYNQTNVRQITLPFDVDEFREAVGLLELIRTHTNVDNNTEAAMAAMRFYCEHHALYGSDEADTE